MSEFVVITGVSGAGRSQAADDLEDLGWFVIDNLPPELAGLRNLDFAAAYQGWIPIQQSYRATLAYQFSWQRVDLRFGWGFAAVPYTWLLQAFDLSYRFGGTTRRTEKVVRKNFKQDKDELDMLEGIDFEQPPTDNGPDPRPEDLPPLPDLDDPDPN